MGKPIPLCGIRCSKNALHFLRKAEDSKTPKLKDSKQLKIKKEKLKYIF